MWTSIKFYSGFLAFVAYFYALTIAHAGFPLDL